MCLRHEERTEKGIKASFALGGMSYRPALEGSIIWETLECGALKITQDVQIRADYPLWLPRYGLQWTVPPRFHHVKYYGYGPEESYEDKHLASRVGLFCEDALTNTPVYVRPQESGSHFGTRLLTLTDDEGFGFQIASDSPFSFNVQQWTPEELAHAAHPRNLAPSSALTLNVDIRMAGVGSASVGPALPVRYRLNPGERLHQTLYLMPFSQEKDAFFAPLE